MQAKKSVSQNARPCISGALTSYTRSFADNFAPARSAGHVYKWQYNAQGLPIQNADEDGRASSAEFDNFLRLSKQMDALGNTTSQSYQIADGSSSGSLGSLIDPTEIQYPSFTQQTKYDSRERPTSRSLEYSSAQGTQALSSTNSATTCDLRGQVKTKTDGNGKTRLCAYNVLGQLTDATGSLGCFDCHTTCPAQAQVPDFTGSLGTKSKPWQAAARYPACRQAQHTQCAARA